MLLYIEMISNCKQFLESVTRCLALSIKMYASNQGCKVPGVLLTISEIGLGFQRLKVLGLRFMTCFYLGFSPPLGRKSVSHTLHR